MADTGRSETELSPQSSYKSEEASDKMIVNSTDSADGGDLMIAVPEHQMEIQEVPLSPKMMSKRQLHIWTHLFRLGFPIMGIACFIYLLFIVVEPDNWKTNNDATDQDKVDRTDARGMFVSIVGAAFTNAIGGFMFHIGVSERLVITNYGFILNPVISYILDQGVGSDEGLSTLFTWDGIVFTFGSLINGNFGRFIVTFMLDLFISNPLQDVMKTQARRLGVIEELMNEKWTLWDLDDMKQKPEWLKKTDKVVALLFPSLLQSAVAVITFGAYTNKTRWLWAYPEESIDRDLRIQPGTICLATSGFGVMYLVFYSLMDTFSDREYYAVNTKLSYVVFTLGWLYLLEITSCDEAPIDGEDDWVLTENIEGEKWFIGLLVFIGFVCYGFVYPVWTKLGCACLGDKCMPTKHEMNTQDHVMNEPKEMQVSSPVINAIMKRINTLRDQASPIAGLGPSNLSIRSSKSGKAKSPENKQPLINDTHKTE